MMHALRTTTLCAAVAAVAALLAGCGSSVKLDDQAPVESRTGSGTTSTTPRAAATGPSGSSSVTPVTIPGGTVSAANLGRLVYFDFDSFTVKEDFRPLIESHAKVLATNKGKRMTIEGHTDERGGREYNLALGQKRAEAVAKSLALLGATDAQLEAVSFGKERPVVEGHDESSWAKNRRAELKDR
ncbi:peptidoglycan-associated lipoprotein Pal [Aquincola sp. S2]|uniref:Peptidoglycan-associated lipoprotein n=1 Tax=Pseudaquabacterium terrae TaxID=2732868 RepID=A0ABX2EFY2_9BURK|nr:peptidoglycan-associated lipoprotein Pal [Aquabacterium terrae]NRF67544.1 peptidoglycan-associated lipoprotein Pal [Aquabacterium terrae]